jgi:U3 small nucleolar RNA-associated protein 3
MNRLLTLKQALITLEDLEFATDEDDEDDEIPDDIYSTEMKWDDILEDRKSIWDSLDTEDLDENELVDLLADADAERSSRKKKAKSKKAAKEENEEVVKPSPKKKRKVAPAPVFDLEEPDWEPTKKSKSRKQKETDDTYGEASHLEEADVADKSARKKSLRFHTSKIESASNRRNNARSAAVGGDDDIPYRERQKEKQMRLDREAVARLQKQGGADLDDEEPEPMQKRKREDDTDSGGDSGNESAEEYYELIKSKSKEEKTKKKEEYNAARAAEKYVARSVHMRLADTNTISLRPEYTEEEADGPRSLTRAILKNRGLTPHRSKSVRNPRVKKRQKYDKAKKKVSSQKAVYKGGLAESGGKYGGEKSGISKVIKSVKLV